jgi:hypothetical protein
VQDAASKVQIAEIRLAHSTSLSCCGASQKYQAVAETAFLLTGECMNHLLGWLHPETSAPHLHWVKVIVLIAESGTLPAAGQLYRAEFGPAGFPRKVSEVQSLHLFPLSQTSHGAMRPFLSGSFSCRIKNHQLTTNVAQHVFFCLHCIENKDNSSLT